jgi:hypothetical protein
MSTYLCEIGFLNYAATKIKHKNRLNVVPDLKLNSPISGQTYKEFVKVKRKTVPHTENCKYVAC